MMDLKTITLLMDLKQRFPFSTIELMGNRHLGGVGDNFLLVRLPLKVDEAKFWHDAQQLMAPADPEPEPELEDEEEDGLCMYPHPRFGVCSKPIGHRSRFHTTVRGSKFTDRPSSNPALEEADLQGAMQAEGTARDAGFSYVKTDGTIKKGND